MLTQIRKIDNTRAMPRLTFLIVGVLLFIAVWFFKGGSFQLYASMFFGLYYLTNTVWVSIILVSLLQNIAFLPLRMIGDKLLPKFKEFEDEVEASKVDDQQLLVSKKMREGDSSVLIYVLNFVLVAIAFVSAGRVFLLDFYYEKISTHYLYNFIPYPEYPLKGTIFYWPYLKILQTTSVSWTTIFYIWVGIIGVMILARLGWRLAKLFLAKNQKVLQIRIAYNKLLLLGGGLAGVGLIVSTFVLRHVPSQLQFVWLQADLSKQNTAFNIVTSVATFFATIYIGHTHNKEAAKDAQRHGIAPEVISKIMKSKFKLTIRNAFLLAGFAYWLTHQMPCSHDLSVLAFEAIYILAPYTIDKFIKKQFSGSQVKSAN